MEGDQPLSPPPLAPEDGDHYDEDEGYDDDDGDGDGAAALPLRKGPWTPIEDDMLRDYVHAHGEGNWDQIRIRTRLNRCGKSCRIRWLNHLKPGLKTGPFSEEEVDKILRMHFEWGNKWAKMATHLPGRTDNEIKNFWNNRLKRQEKAGLPIYPEYLLSQASNQDMNFGAPEESRDTKRPNELSQNVLQIPDEHGKAGCPTSFNNGMTETQLVSPGNAFLSAHPILDGNPSTSWASQWPMNSELPSIQYSNYGIWNPIEHADMLIESPGSLKPKSTPLQITDLDAIGYNGDGIVNPIKSHGVSEVPPLSCNQVSGLNVPPVSCNEASKSPSTSGAIHAESKCDPDTSFNAKHISPEDIFMLDASLQECFLNDGSLIDEELREEAMLSTAGHALDLSLWNINPGL